MSLKRLRVEKARCRARVKMWKLSHTDVGDCGERHNMYLLVTGGDAPIARGQTWLHQPSSVSTVPNTGSILFCNSDRGLDEEDR